MQALGKERAPATPALAVPDVQLAAAEIDVFHAQAQALHQPHTAAVEQIGNQPVDAVEVAKQAPDFRAAQYDG